MQSLRPYFAGHLIQTMEADRPDQLAAALIPVMEVSSASPINIDFMDKVEQMS